MRQTPDRACGLIYDNLEFAYDRKQHHFGVETIGPQYEMIREGILLVAETL